MPWLETEPMQQRVQFVADYYRGLYTMTELCARYGVSRKTGYKRLQRFEEEGRAGLKDRSHAPHKCPQRIEKEIATLLCETRRAHPSWGPYKLLKWLRPRYPRIRHWPALSTIGDLLAREGLVRKRRRRRQVKHRDPCRSRRRRRTICGRPTSRGTSARAMGSTAIR